MKKLISASLLSLAFAFSSFGQIALTQTTLSAAIDSTMRSIPVASTTGIAAGNAVLLDNEILTVASVYTGMIVVAPRGSAGTYATGHVSGTMVLAGNSQAFIAFDPSGSCTNGKGLFQFAPVVNTRTGNQWLCSPVTGKVAPGFSNSSDVAAPTAAVASAAGKITPSGPLFHITGALAITGFNLPVGFDPSSGGQICAIPDGTYTTTNATNIAIASTAVVSRPMCWTYDPATTKFYPSY